jgi:cation diffusion facilitator family transporter
MSAGHHHHHHHDDDEDSERKTRLVVCITLIMMVVEVSYGYFTNSMALLADGWHMGTHAAALMITLYAYYYVRNEAKVKDKRDKVMALGGFASAIVLGIVAMYIGWESIGRITDPKEILFEEALIVATVGLVVNLVCAKILGIDNHHHGPHHDHEEDKSQKSEKGTWAAVIDSYKNDWKFISDKFDNIMTNPDDIEDLNRRGAYLHVLADALVSVLVILALLIGMQFSNLVILDPIIGIVAGLVIARWSIGLLIESRNQILELEG